MENFKFEGILRKYIIFKKVKKKPFVVKYFYGGFGTRDSQEFTQFLNIAIIEFFYKL
jgi:hypothetical protein